MSHVANTTIVGDEQTARTCRSAAFQRAEYLAVLGARSVLELCVGPSLRMLESAYSAHGISVTGNDIDHRWRTYHPRGCWLIGDAFEIDWSGFDTIVFAPPLSRGCTGTREDSLSVAQVTPPYNAFLQRLSLSRVARAVMVLPGRALATREDRRQTHDLIALCAQNWASAIVPLFDSRGRVVKYNDLYLQSLSACTTL